MPIRGSQGKLMMIPAQKIDPRCLREAPRLCRDCAQLSIGGRCLASRRLGADLPFEFFPKAAEPRFCSGFEPYSGSRDERQGSELWPGLEMVSEIPMAGDAMASAAIFLADQIAHGEKSADAIIAAGEERGILRRSVQRASVLLGVRKRRTRFGGHWLWFMPECYGDKA